MRLGASNKRGRGHGSLELPVTMVAPPRPLFFFTGPYLFTQDLPPTSWLPLSPPASAPLPTATTTALAPAQAAAPDSAAAASAAVSPNNGEVTTAAMDDGTACPGDSSSGGGGKMWAPLEETLLDRTVWPEVRQLSGTLGFGLLDCQVSIPHCTPAFCGTTLKLCQKKSLFVGATWVRWLGSSRRPGTDTRRRLPASRHHLTATLSHQARWSATHARSCPSHAFASPALRISAIEVRSLSERAGANYAQGLRHPKMHQFVCRAHENTAVLAWFGPSLAGGHGMCCLFCARGGWFRAAVCRVLVAGAA